jgi:hypothetical protein
MHVAALFTLWGEPAAQAFFDALQANEVRIALVDDLDGPSQADMAERESGRRS